MSVASPEAGTLWWPTPDGLTVRGTLVIVPGRGEHPALYQRFGRRLAADAYRTHAVADPVWDADLTRQQVAEASADPGHPAPLILVGSDTGALFTAGLVASGQAPGVAALILAGLPTAGPANGAPQGADTERDPGPGRWETELDDRTSCPAHRANLADSPLRRGALYDDVPPGWLAAADLAAIGVPILGLHGAADRVSPLAAARESYARAPAVELVSVAGGRHDVLNDVSHRSVAAAVVLFLERLRADAGLAPVVRPELSLDAAR